MIVCNIFGLLIWSVRTAHGAGHLINAPATKSGSTLSWNMVYSIQAVLGLWSGGILGQSGSHPCSPRSCSLHSFQHRMIANIRNLQTGLATPQPPTPPSSAKA